MTRDQAKRLVNQLAGQLKTCLKRLKQLEDENILGIEHTALREQANATLKIIETLEEELPHPFLPIDFQVVQEVKKEFSFSWLGWL